MATLDDVRDAANPFNKLAEKLDVIVEQNEIKIKLLSRFCDLKEHQQERDDAFRSTWAAAKRKDNMMGMCVLTIAGVALYLDYFRGWPVIKWLTSLVS